MKLIGKESEGKSKPLKSLNLHGYKSNKMNGLIYRVFEG